MWRYRRLLISPAGRTVLWPLALAVVGCAAEDDSPQGEGGCSRHSITAEVADATGQPVCGATVVYRLDGGTATPMAAEGCQYTAQLSDGGTVVVSAVDEGFSTASGSVTLPPLSTCNASVMRMLVTLELAPLTACTAALARTMRSSGRAARWARIDAFMPVRRFPACASPMTPADSRRCADRAPGTGVAAPRQIPQPMRSAPNPARPREALSSLGAPGNHKDDAASRSSGTLKRVGGPQDA